MDFFLIGAMKSGTTALFNYLSQHPALCLPKSKELPYFAAPEFARRTLGEVTQAYFGHRRDRQLLGTVTPQYMCDQQVPARIAKALPNVKIIAVLRAPHERAESHYKMEVRRNREPRTLEAALLSQLHPGELAKAREATFDPTHTHESYIAWGEYGRILTPYFTHFPRDNILIAFYDELETAPATLYKNILEFLQVDARYQPPNLGERIHVSGTKRKLDIWEWMRRRPNLKRIWKLLPESTRVKVAFGFETWNVIPDRRTHINFLSQNCRSKLYSTFADDLPCLEALIERPVPWRTVYDQYKEGTDISDNFLIERGEAHA